MVSSPTSPPGPSLAPRLLAPYDPYGTTSPSSSLCPRITLSVGGTVEINPTSTITISTPIVYLPPCPTPDPAFGDMGSSITTFADNNTKFYASTTPLIYVVGATTVIAWTLMILLIITRSTVPTSVANSRQGMLPGRRIIDSIRGRNGSGSRPLLQKLASLLVAVSLTIATADTVIEAERQYSQGWFDGTEMREKVAGSLEIRVTRVISDVFIWLAQIQTLIRLFPRHREKLVIKWVGFVLIILECIFTSLDSFLINSRNRPRDFQDAIPALAYLFQLSLSLLYAAWVLYYVATKRQFAFYHPRTPNICIIAMLSIAAILIPIVFFVVDITEPSIGGWGDYFRWVGAAAASVVVWEWVERIEALEREQRSDGILGREVYDGDEMIDHTPSDARSSSNHNSDGSGSPGQSGYSSSSLRKASFKPVYHLLFKWLSDSPKKSPTQTSDTNQEKPADSDSSAHQRRVPRGQRPRVPQNVDLRPIQEAAASINRDESNSAGTVYAVHYHSVSVSPPPPQPDPRVVNGAVQGANSLEVHPANADRADVAKDQNADISGTPGATSNGELATSSSLMNMAANAFKRRKKSPPLEVKKAMSLDATSQKQQPNRRNIVSLLTSSNGQSTQRDEGPQAAQEPTVIPAPPRGQTWSPHLQRHSPVQPRTGDSADVRNGTPIQQPVNISDVLYSQDQAGDGRQEPRGHVQSSGSANEDTQSAVDRAHPNNEQSSA